MRVVSGLAAAVLLLPAAAQAATCEESFVKSGSVISGLRFKAAVTVNDLTPASAIGQMRGIAAAKGYDILVAEADEGSMLIEQPQTGSARAFPITVTAVSNGRTGTVEMEAKLRAGQNVSADLAKSETCKMLGQVKGGRAGQTAAAAGMRAVNASAPLTIDALTLSQQISKDSERNAAAIPLRYRGKTFVIKGTVGQVGQDRGEYLVAYQIPHPHEQLIRLPGQAAFKTDIGCAFAKGQAAFALQLKPGSRIQLSGTFHRYDANNRLLLLKDCRNAR